MADSKSNKVKVSQYDGTHVKVGDRYERFDKGSAIPDHADADHVKLLEDRGMVADGEAFGGLAVENLGPAPFNVDEDAKASRSRRSES